MNTEASALSPQFNRRAALKLAGASLAVGLAAPESFAAKRRAKKAIVAGG